MTRSAERQRLATLDDWLASLVQWVVIMLAFAVLFRVLR